MRKLLELIESRGNFDISKPWTMDASQWLIAHDIKQPWIAEISPMQYARMGKSAKEQYDKKRNAEWQAAIDGKREWAKAVVNAHKEGKFDKNSPGVNPDALVAVKHGEMDDEKKQKEDMFKKAQDENRIEDLSVLKPGDVVSHVIYRKYMTVKKVNKKSVVLEDPRGTTTAKPGFIEWLSYNDLKAKMGL